MTEFLKYFPFAFKSVAAVFLIAGTGAFIVRKKYIKDESLQLLSKLIILILFPCLSFTKIIERVDLEQIKKLWILPVSSCLFVFVGIILGYLVVLITKPKSYFKGGVIAATGFGNAGFIPYPLVIAMALSFPIFQNESNVEMLGIGYISLFLIGFTPLTWSLGYALVAGNKLSEIRWKQVITPPVFGMIFGIILGIIPTTKYAFCDNNGVFNFVFNAMSIIGTGTIPCSLILLGGKLAHGPTKNSVNIKTIIAVTVAKLIILPILAIFYVKCLLQFEFMSFDKMLILVLIIEAAMPPGTSLIVMTSLKGNKKEEEAMATLLFWTYIISIITITIFIVLTMNIFKLNL